MSYTINKSIVLGKLGKDVELKFTPSGMGVATTTLATSSREKQKDGSYEEVTEWHNLKFLGKPAEIVAEHAKKGSQLYVEGKTKTESWDDKATGQKRYKSYILADEFVILTKLDKPVATVEQAGGEARNSDYSMNFGGL